MDYVSRWYVWLFTHTRCSHGASLLRLMTWCVKVFLNFPLESSASSSVRPTPVSISRCRAVECLTSFTCVVIYFFFSSSPHWPAITAKHKLHGEHPNELHSTSLVLSLIFAYIFSVERKNHLFPMILHKTPFRHYRFSSWSGINHCSTVIITGNIPSENLLKFHLEIFFPGIPLQQSNPILHRHWNHFLAVFGS